MNIKSSYCRKPGWLHNFKITQEHKKSDYKIVEERCERCHQRMFFKMSQEGRIDNVAYIRSHIRQALTKNYNLYYHEYNKERPTV